MMFLLGILIMAAYLIGSIPFGFLLTRLGGYGDIRAIGSGNIGATNVLRTGNKVLALLTLLLDGGKGALAIALLSHIPAQQGFTDLPMPHVLALLIGFAVIIGHCFPFWLDFKGGKGVATTMGVLAVAAPFTALGVLVVWLAVVLITRLSSLAALTRARR